MWAKARASGLFVAGTSEQQCAHFGQSRSHSVASRPAPCRLHCFEQALDQYRGEPGFIVLSGPATLPDEQAIQIIARQCAEFVRSLLQGQATTKCPCSFK